VKHTLPPIGNKSGGMTMSATNSAVAASVRAAQRVDTLQECVDEVPTGER